MKKWVLIFLTIVVILLATGIIKSFEKEPAAHPEWVARWLEDPVCLPPCWESITPGETTMSKVSEALLSVPGITDVHRDSIDSKKFKISWMFDEKTGGGGINSDSEGLLVHEIVWTGYGNMELHEIIRQYGEPTRVFVDPVSHMWDHLVYLFYDDQGMLLHFTEPEILFFNQVRIKPDTSHIAVVFFSPQGDYLDSFANELFYNNTWYTWQGYGRYRSINEPTPSN